MMKTIWMAFVFLFAVTRVAANDAALIGEGGDLQASPRQVFLYGTMQIESVPLIGMPVVSMPVSTA